MTVLLLLLALLPIATLPDVPPQLKCLVESYPGALCSATATELVWCDGTRMPYRTGPERTNHAERLANGDLADQMRQTYTPFVPATPPAVDQEPGRIRNEAFFAKLYGNTKAEVLAHTTRLTWLDGKILRVTTRFGIDQRLAAVRDELRTLPGKVAAPAFQTEGTLVWRTIRGTTRRSAHAYAMAIDVGVPVSDYWQWHAPDAQGKLEFRNRMPIEVVRVFEKHGFVWGGRWYHYDTMHFEFRPELLHPACVGGNTVRQ